LSKSKRLLFFVNDAGFFVSHRLPLALAARAAGYEVHVATAPSDAVAEIVVHGIPHHAVELSRSGVNPLAEVRSFLQVIGLLRRLRPQLVHLVTVKPVLYGGIAARLTGVPAMVAAISGLGDAFAAQTVRARLVRPLVRLAYQVALGHKLQRVIFQNPSDRDTLSKAVGLSAEEQVMVRGSGVDLHVYRPEPEPGGVPVVTFASRLLRTKGIHEFVAAARWLRATGVTARFQLVGDVDPGNNSSVSAAEIAAWRTEGVVQVLGQRSDVPAIFAASNLIVLPSYYGEGLPKVLVEAAACGRAVVTTDMPGCRDAVEPGKTALLVPPRDATALGEAIRVLVTDPVRRRAMGAAARALAERDYALEQIVSTHLAMYHDLLGTDEVRG